MIKHFWSDRSLFLKLVLVLLLVTMVLNFSVALFFHRYSFGPRKAVGQFIRGCTHYVMAGLGNPPNAARAMEVSRHLGVALRIESPEGNFSTTNWILPSNLVRFRPYRRHGPEESPLDDVLFGQAGGRPYLMVDQGPYRFLVSPEFPMDNKDSLWPLLALLGVISAVLGFAWMTLRHIFKPIQRLDAGVRQVAKGNFDVQLEATRGDELGHLSESFNQMTKQVRENLHSKEQLLYNVSHELRSPLARMKLSLAMMPETKHKDNLGEEVLQMESMIDELLESARLGSTYGVLNLEELDIIGLLEGLCRQEGCAFTGLDAQGIDRIYIEGDSRRLERMFSNLIQNGIKYSPGKEPVEVELSLQGGWVQVLVVDHGIGIPGEEIPFVFEPFYRVDKSRSSQTGGYGLGLSLCQQIAEAHQGKIEVHSQSEVGTTFTVRLPLS